MERSHLSTLSTLFTAVLFTGAFLLSGCSDSLTGTTPPDQDVTVQQRIQHNQISMSDDGDTDPQAGHNTSNED